MLLCYFGTYTLGCQAQEALLSPLQYLFFSRYDSLFHQHLAVDYGAVHSSAHAVYQMGDYIAPGAEPGLSQVDEREVG